MVPRDRIELPTRGFSVPCSTNWATEALSVLNEAASLSLPHSFWRPEGGSNPWPLAWQASALTNWATGPYGGNNRARTYDPLLVRQMLSQLSYASIFLAVIRRLRYYITFQSVCQYLFEKFFYFFQKFFWNRRFPLRLPYYTTILPVCQHPFSIFFRYFQK